LILAQKLHATSKVCMLFLRRESKVPMEGKKLKSGLVLAALGVVYGDIGTSPLYALREAFHDLHGISVIEANVLGILSLIFWSLILIITIKYNLLILRADNKGEGGTLALTALISGILKHNSKRLRVLTLFGLFGTALLYGDGMITPAISVLSAVEGLELVQPGLHPYIIPITVVILIVLFMIQRHGTELVGKIFGPVTLTWFLTLAILGVLKIMETPHVLVAVNPFYAYEFMINNGGKAFIVLGSVFLVVTGGEAMYSDLGHFGKKPVNLAWFSCVLPCLVLNYFGQGALLLKNPGAVKNPFFLLAPEWALLPLVILATLATVIASQALITGIFSLTMQAIQLQYLPRMRISHTSHVEFGQIYVGTMNLLLMIACITLVLSFKSSSALVAAYGIAVTMTMLITTVLFYFLARFGWKWSNWIVIPLCGFFLAIEGSFFGANVLKIPQGGWFPLVVGAAIFTIMSTWNRGRKILSERMLEMITPITDVLERIEKEKIQRVPGMAVYMAGHPQYAPSTVTLNLQHYHSLHEIVVIVTVRTEEVPFVNAKDRSSISSEGKGFYRVQLHYGFMEVPNVPRALKGLRLENGEPLPLETATYFLGQEFLVPTKNSEGMAVWRERLFAVLSRNSQPASRFFGLPPGRVITVGITIEL
jgi:KUP system potassium uptake protein